MKVLLANPRGFCAGVDRAIEIVERALSVHGAPIYVRHEVVHNTTVVNDLRTKGAVFVDELDEIPAGATVIFSAHGVSQQVRQEAQQHKLQIFDATCPLVTKVHHEVARYARDDYEVILIGHAGHPEVEGTMGQYYRDGGAGGVYLVEKAEDVEQIPVKQVDRVAYVTQTTLSVDDTANVIKALRQRFPSIVGPRKDDICYATQNRQDAVKSLALHSDVVMVVGSANSSNSNRLREIAQLQGVPAYLIDTENDIEAVWLEDMQVIGVTAGASAPEILVQSVINRLIELGVTEVETLSGKTENVSFSLPKSLQQA